MKRFVVLGLLCWAASSHAAVVAHYSFDTDVQDVSGNGNGGTLVDVGTTGNSGVTTNTGAWMFGSGALHLDAERDLTDVRDVVAAYVALMAGGAPGTAYNVCRGSVVRMSDVLDRLIARARVSVTRVTDPARLRPNDLATLCGDPGRLTRDTGWAPTIPLDVTLGDLLDDWRRRVAAEPGA